MPNSVTYLNQTHVFHGKCLGVAPNMDTKKTYFKEIGLYAQNLITILESIVNIIGGEGLI